jgi:hypothetical protein
MDHRKMVLIIEKLNGLVGARDLARKLTILEESRKSPVSISVSDCAKTGVEAKIVSTYEQEGHYISNQAAPVG